MIKTTLIASFCLVIAACSSGGSGSTEGVNITGRWTGDLQLTTDVTVRIEISFAQLDTVGVPGNTRTSTVTYSVTFNESSDPTGTIQSCLRTLAGETAQINAESNPATLTGDGLSAVVINNRISGQAVWEGDDDCVVGGPFAVTRAGTR
ncbi:MAG: hypothetical protein ACRBEE_08335 [Arenicella sp.]